MEVFEARDEAGMGCLQAELGSICLVLCTHVCFFGACVVPENVESSNAVTDSAARSGVLWSAVSDMMCGLPGAV